MNQPRGGQVFSGYCPDPDCKKQLFFPSYLSSSVECTSCGQRHRKSALTDVRPVSDPGVAIRSLLQNILISSVDVTKKCAESVKVKGLSNYRCKLVSPLLTKYGLDRKSGTVKLLSNMGQGPMFDCSHLSDRSFQIEEENLNVPGYGLDKSGARDYLTLTLESIGKSSGERDALVPIHADGDGHCLVHALSRAIVGRELFWHPLMENLKRNLNLHHLKYKLQFQDFIDEAEWCDIIAEAGPDYEPADGEPLGLRNIHIFGLANVLRRPIILLDGQEGTGITTVGHYGGVYLPVLCTKDSCKNKESVLNKPLVIAWSSSGRNHFVPLVGIKGRSAPKFPRTLMPEPWGVPSNLIDEYIDFDENSMCCVGGEKSLQDKYLHKLVISMEQKFQELNGIAPELVADVYQHVFKPSGVVGVSPQLVTEAAQVAVNEERLYRCLTCHVVIEESLPVSIATLKPKGQLYQIAVYVHGQLKDNCSYRFPQHNNIVCRYDKGKDMLIPKRENIACKYCQGQLRLLNANGSLKYFNGDHTSTPAKDSKCGYKHFWDGKEYDKLPEKLRVVLEWNNTTKEDYVYWFQNEADSLLNSNAYELAQNLIQKHFPGEFGSERLKQRVVDQIFRQTVQKSKEPAPQPSIGQGCHSVPTKIILTGEKAKSLHKEELGVSNTEKVLKKKIEHSAALQQKRSSSSPCKGHTSASSESKELSVTIPSESINVAQSEPSTTATSPSPSKEKKIRLSVANASHATVALTEGMTFHDLQGIIEEKLGVPKELQLIKYGFPPKILEAPPCEDDPLPLQHGDRLMIDKKVVKIKETEENNEETSKNNSFVEQETNILKQMTRNDQDQRYQGIDQDTEAKLTAEIQRRFLNELGKNDIWEIAQDKPYLFRPNGIFYEQIQRDMGPLTNGQHCTLPCFPGKVFSYNEECDEIFLCLGKRHVPVQPITDEMHHTVGSTNKHLPTAGGEHSMFSTGEREIATLLGRARREPKIVAFSGKGRSLSENNTDGTLVKHVIKDASHTSLLNEEITEDHESNIGTDNNQLTSADHHKRRVESQGSNVLDTDDKEENMAVEPELSKSPHNSNVENISDQINSAFAPEIAALDKEDTCVNKDNNERGDMQDIEMLIPDVALTQTHHVYSLEGDGSSSLASTASAQAMDVDKNKSFLKDSVDSELHHDTSTSNIQHPKECIQGASPLVDGSVSMVDKFDKENLS